ncbi:MAG: DUF2380 domain-containing protein [Kiloniellales bacterium]
MGSIVRAARPTASSAFVGVTVALALFCFGTGSAAAELPRVAVFDFELIDTSLEGELSGPRADEQQRLVLIGDLLRRQLAESGRYEVVDIAPQAAAIERAGHLYGCNGCETKIARALGADLALRGTVQKVSNLILNINLYLRNAASGEQLRVMSVDIRGNTDESWTHGIRYLLRNRLLKEPAPQLAVAQRQEPAEEKAMQFINSPAAKVAKLPFSQAVRVGDVLYLSGALGNVPGKAELVPGGMAAEARQTMENIGAVLKENGLTFDHVFKCTVMLADMAKWADFNEVYVTYFKPDRLPARSAFGANGLALGAQVEVECMAYLGEE